MTKCKLCIEDRKYCINCKDNPIYKKIPEISLFKPYCRDIKIEKNN